MEERGYKIFPSGEDQPTKDSEVFYNPEMLINRDLSEIAAKVFNEKVEVEFRSCTPLAASGIRGFRYARFSDRLFMNDVNPKAVESIRKGLEANKIKADVFDKDANIVLSERRNFFHLIDIDPFGSFVNFLDSTARAANHKSFVGLTATDNGVPGGSYPKVCGRKYGSKPIKPGFKHEVGLRIYIRSVFENFARYNKAFDPKICFHEGHYTRVMGRVTESKQRCNNSLENIGWLSYCRNCLWRKLKRTEKCPECGEKVEIAGPLWTGKFVDRRFSGRMIEEMPVEWERSRKMLDKLHGEAEILTPYYDLHKLCSSMGVTVPKRKSVIKEIGEKGYPVTRTHFADTGIRTDAPIKDIKEVIQELSE